MQVLSATQSISPAIARTRDLLFRPFRWGTFLKLCIVAVFTEGLSGNFNNHHGGAEPHIPGGPAMAPFNPAIIPVIAIIVLACFAVAIVVFYFVTRLRFALFNCLVHQTRLISPGWNGYRSQATRFFVFSIMVGVVFFVGIVAALLPFAARVWRVYQENRLSGQFPNTEIVALVLQFIPVILLIALAGVCVDIVMRDFMLPHYALENASAGQAIIAVWESISREPGAFLLYGILRVVLPMVAMIAIFIALFIPCLVIFGALGLTIAGVHAAMGSGAGPLTAVGWVFVAILALIIVAFAALLAVCIGGPLGIAVRNYALMFYGGRYSTLGNTLSPPPPAMQPGNA